MENKKKWIILASILLGYVVIMILFFGTKQVKNRIYHLDLILNPDTYIKYENGIWSDVTKDTKKMLSKSYHIYSDHQFLYDGVLQYTLHKWYAFDKHDQPLSLPDSFFAYRGNRKIDLYSFKEEELLESELQEVKGLLKNEQIDIALENLNLSKVRFDLNQDSKEETIFIASNAFQEEQSIYFSIVFLKMNGKTDVLIKDISEDMMEVPGISLREIFDYNGDHNSELLFEKIYFDQIGTCHQILEYENSYQTIKPCTLIERGDV